jgi:hypothetical protein
MTMAPVTVIPSLVCMLLALLCAWQQHELLQLMRSRTDVVSVLGRSANSSAVSSERLALAASRFEPLLANIRNVGNCGGALRARQCLEQNLLASDHLSLPMQQFINFTERSLVRGSILQNTAAKLILEHTDRSVLAADVANHVNEHLRKAVRELQGDVNDRVAVADAIRKSVIDVQRQVQLVVDCVLLSV